jgi:beta-glucosidase
VTERGDAWVLEVQTTNTGSRAGKHVVQVYASRADSAVDRPVRWLVGFAVVRAAAGGTATALIEVSHRSVAHWSEGWCYEPGTYTLHVGNSVAEVVHVLDVELQEA